MAIRNFVSYVILMKNEFVQHHCSLTMCVTFVSPLSILWPQTRLLSLIRWHDILWYDRSYIIKIFKWYQISYWIVGIIWYGDVTSYITEMMIWYDMIYDMITPIISCTPTDTTYVQAYVTCIVRVLASRFVSHSAMIPGLWSCFPTIWECFPKFCQVTTWNNTLWNKYNLSRAPVWDARDFWNKN